jgi:L-aminopeptidase/D-esterase-like protein
VITDVEGVRVGHWTDHRAKTGCTVVLLPDGTVASGEIRGGAPATREFDLLEPTRTVTRLDAVVLTGGSAFGLAAADGVARWLEEQGVGFETRAGVVPIVVGLGLFDLAEGDPHVRPGPDDGIAACRAATDGAFEIGRVGAGAGATVGGWRGRDQRRPGGVGTATVVESDLVVAALVVVNAVGSIDEPGLERGLAPLRTLGVEPGGSDPVDAAADADADAAGAARVQTTLGVVVTNARLDKAGCRRVAEGGHDGMARALFPPHTSADGDAIVAAATGAVDAPIDLVRTAAVVAVDAAIRQLAASH